MSSVRLDKTRLAALHRTGLLQVASEAAFDRVARLAARSLGAPVALISLVDRERQVLKGQVGLPEPLAAVGELPPDGSLCPQVVERGKPLVVADAREDPLLAGTPAVRELGIVGYVGMPLRTSEGHDLGVLSVVSREERAWTDDQVECLRDLAAAAVTEIELRCARRELESEREPREASLGPPPPPSESRTVLLVEDEEPLRRLIARVLTRGGYSVSEAEEPRAALRLAEEGLRPDLLLTDVVMPGMSGQQLSERLRERHPQLRVLVMSGFTEKVVERYGVDQGLRFIPKPFTPQALLDAVRSVLEQPQPQRGPSPTGG